ncbi:MAG: DEAD/DEAH box helicase, partial [Planctomycetota bacterium]
MAESLQSGRLRASSVRDVVEQLRRDAFLGDGVVVHRVDPATPARYADLPAGLDPRLGPALAARGITRLYTHQRQAYDHIAAGRHTVAVTPTASGKT